MTNWFNSIPFILWVLGITMADEHLVMTPSGPVRGTTTKTFSGQDVDVFYGIPYAEPPVGSLRFGPPVEVKPWTKELNATGRVLPCYQQIPATYFNRQVAPEMRSFLNTRPWSEDCLKLHVWVPKPRPKNSTVMVNIHGGGFVMGDPQHPFFNAATLAAEQNVITVSMHYRLGILGFLYLEIPEAPGNVALLDQQMALKWVQRNIHAFGGNPDDVTIYGLSAGGASVGYQLLAPTSVGLFKRAIVMSGVPNAPWAPNFETVLEESLILATYQGCAKGDRTEMLRCLQAVHPEDFSQYNFSPFIMERFCVIGPTVDGKFILDSPKKLLKNKVVNPADLMIGTTAGEMSSFVAFMLPEIMLHPDGRITPKQFKAVIDKEFMYHDDLTRKMLAFMYTNWTYPEDPYQLRDDLLDMMSDYFFVCPSQEFADAYSDAGNRVYRYVVEYTSKILPMPDWAKSPHGIDAVLHTGMSTGKGFSEKDAILSRKVMTWWGNFARTGNPNSNELDPSAEIWPQTTSNEQEHLVIAHHPTVGRNFRKEQCGLLLNFLETMAQHRQRKRH